MKKILSLFMVMSVILFNGFMLFEGSTAGAATYTADFDVTLLVNAASAFNCNYTTDTPQYLGSLVGLTGGHAEGIVSCLVTTNDVNGWDLYIKDVGGYGGQMRSPSSSIAAYPASTPEAWDPTIVTSSNSYYGYYASSTHPVSGYGPNLYRDLTDSNVAVAGNTAATAAAGETTYFGFKVELGSLANQPSGLYASHVETTLTER